MQTLLIHDVESVKFEEPEYFLATTGGKVYWRRIVIQHEGRTLIIFVYPKNTSSPAEVS